MRQLCTLSDKNYLLQGLALHESLRAHSNDYMLNYLCLDNESYNKLTSLKFSDLKPYNVNELVESDESLKKLKNSDYRHFCYTLASYFSHYLLKKEPESITYIDSDIFFYKNINILYEKFNDKDIAIFKHRQFAYEQNRPEGAFNVGIVYFKNTELGKSILSWWSDAVINRKYPHLATCGDQKYLDEFPKLCFKNEIYIDGDIGHGAPWQWQLYDYSKINEGKIIYKNEEQDLVFTHFSQFKFDLKNETFKHSVMHQPYTNDNKIFKLPEIDNLYKEYFNIILKINKNYF